MGFINRLFRVKTVSYCVVISKVEFYLKINFVFVSFLHKNYKLLFRRLMLC